MKNTIGILYIIVTSLLILFSCSISTTHAYTVRKPVFAGSFYPHTPEDLKDTISNLTRLSAKRPVNTPEGKSLKALILPHAGYIYSGLTAAHASSVLSKNQFQKIILIGPDHRVGFKNGAISDVNAYQTPLGIVDLHDQASRLRQNSSLFSSVSASDKSEHSLEVILPFLQYYIGQFKIIPIVMGPGDIGGIVSALMPLIDSDTLLVASSDLSHYLPYDEAVKTDNETIRMILNLEYEKLAKKDNAACGKTPILCLLTMAKQNAWQPVLLHYSNSGDTAGKKDRVVGYAAIAFFGGSSMEQLNQQQLNRKQGDVLLKLARQTISQRLGVKTAGPDIPKTDLADKDLQSHRGTFVTLKIDHQLRGCIGNLSSSESIVKGVKQNAINAAFSDYRFSPLTVDELKDVDIEISILTEPRPLEFTDKKDLISKLQVNIDGVIIRKGSSSATFLPQVWEQLPEPKEFLSHLCHKAGLSADAWEKPGLEVLTYQVQYFEEE